MYLRLAFWTLAMAYTSVLLSRGATRIFPQHHVHRPALLGAILGVASVACSSIDVLASKAEHSLLIATE